MNRTLWGLLAVGTFPGTAMAAWPEDVSLSSMTQHEGEAVLDQELLGQSFRQLVLELGSLTANQANTPAHTSGIDGFEADLGVRYAMTEARVRDGVSPWSRAHQAEDNAPFLPMPTLSVRKGLPFSTELGASMSWIGGSATGVVGGYGRLAVVEGYKPLPDLTVKVGYSGYIGNDELDLGVLDLGVTLGSTWGLGRLPGIQTGTFSAWMSASTLRISANPVLDRDTADAIGAVPYTGSASPEDPGALSTFRFGAGMQFTAGHALLRLSANWAPRTIPIFSSGLGVTF